MPSIVPEQSTNGVDFTQKEKDFDSRTATTSSGFTAVNGRSNSPPQLTSHSNGHHQNSHQVRSTPFGEDHKPVINSWTHSNPNGSTVRRGSPVVHTRRDTPSSVHKRKRSSSSSESDDNSSEGRPVTDRNGRPIDEFGSDTSQSPTTASSYTRHPISHSSGVSFNHHRGSTAHTNSNEYEDPHWHSRERSGTIMTEARLTESMQREDGMPESSRHSAEYENGDESMVSNHQNQQESGSTIETTRAGVQVVDPKKRKRQFANRTKTGCQTCRRRKKKCDEHKPECNNCIRGQFVCEGYTSKGQWAKPNITRGPVQIQAKDGSYESQGSIYQRPPPPAVPEYDSHAPRPDGARTRPIVVDDGDRQNPNRWSSNWSEPPHRQYSHPPPTEYAPAPQDSRNHHKPYPDPASLAQRPPSAAYGHGHAANSNPAITAQLALQHQSSHIHHQQQPRPQQQPPPPVSEKEKMLKGEDYLLFHPSLIDEREQCKQSLWRFNNATNPAHGVSLEERARLFRTTLEAPWIQRGPGYPQTPRGFVGEGVFVEAPFNCDYGYNINIGDNVIIGPNCTILDPCKITIGANTVIGPNASILGGSINVDPRERHGSKGKGFGKPIRIEEGVFIGGNVTIRYGVTIGQGATVGCGSVVTKDIPPATINAGNPSKVLRGYWLSESR